MSEKTLKEVRAKLQQLADLHGERAGGLYSDMVGSIDEHLLELSRGGVGAKKTWKPPEDVKEATTVQPLLRSRASVAALLGISESMLDEMIASDQLQSIKIRRRVMISEEELQRFLASGTGKKVT